MRTGRKPIRPPQSGITNMDVTSRIWFQIPLSVSIDVHGRILPVPTGLGSLVAGCPAWSSRRGPVFQPGGPSRPGRRRSTGRRGRRRGPTGPRRPVGLPIDGDESRPDARAGRAATPSRPSARRAVAQPCARSRSSVTTRSVAGPSGPSSARTSSTSDEDHVVGGPPAAVADDDARPRSARRAGRARAVRRRRARWRWRPGRRPQPADQRGRRRGAGVLRQRVEQVRAVDQQTVGAGQRVRDRACGIDAIVRGRRAPRLRSGRVSLLLLVDLDGVVYRGADPVPGRRRGPRRSGGPWRRRRLRHQQLDALPGRLPDPARGDGRAGHARHGRLVGAGDGALPARARAGDPARAGPRGERARARAARRRATTW